MFNKEIKTKRSVIGDAYTPYVIAETACAHDGSVDKVKKLIDCAYAAGASAVQLQIFSKEHQMTPDHELFCKLGQLEILPDEWEDVVKYSRRYSFDVFVFAYDIPSFELSIKLGVDGIKLSSADLLNPSMLQLAGESKLPIMLSTGASSVEEIEKALEYLHDSGSTEVVLMHGVQNFPTEIRNLHIRRMALLRERFKCLVGYADHTEGGTKLSKSIDLLAVGMGASVIEKHITLDRSEKGTDHEAALEPEEFRDFVGMIGDAYLAVGGMDFQPFNESDLQYRQFQKKKIVAMRDLEKGENIAGKDIGFLRTGKLKGLDPIDCKKVIGKTLNCDKKKYDSFTIENVA